MAGRTGDKFNQIPIGGKIIGTTFPTRQQVDRAEPLPFDKPAERQGNIQIEATPAGLHVRFEYVGAIGSIPKALDALREAGILELVEASRPTPIAANGKPKAQTVEPLYKPDGTASCPVHKHPLSDGQYGLYCSARAKSGEAANSKGYCALRFAE